MSYEIRIENWQFHELHFITLQSQIARLTFIQYKESIAHSINRLLFADLGHILILLIGKTFNQHVFFTLV